MLKFQSFLPAADSCEVFLELVANAVDGNGVVNHDLRASLITLPAILSYIGHTIPVNEDVVEAGNARVTYYKRAALW